MKSISIIIYYYDQCLELPRAIAMSEGYPVKDTKSTTTNVYEKRYEHATPMHHALSLRPSHKGWVPDTVVIEGMFLINITPWGAHKNIGEYTICLLK